jgi:hypothetical protein
MQSTVFMKQVLVPLCGAIVGASAVVLMTTMRSAAGPTIPRGH